MRRPYQMPYTKSLPQLDPQVDSLQSSDVVALSDDNLGAFAKKATLGQLGEFFQNGNGALAYDAVNDWWYLTPIDPEDGPAFVFASRNPTDQYYPYAFGSPINFDRTLSGHKIPDFRVDSSRRIFNNAAIFVTFNDNPPNFGGFFCRTVSGDRNDPAAFDDPLQTVADATIYRAFGIALAATTDPAYPNGLKWELDTGDSYETGRQVQLDFFSIGAQTDTNRAGAAAIFIPNIDETKGWARQVWHPGGEVTIYGQGQAAHGYSTAAQGTLTLDAGDMRPVLALRTSADRGRGLSFYMDYASTQVEVFAETPGGASVLSGRYFTNTGNQRLGEILYVDRTNARVYAGATATIAGATETLQATAAGSPALAVNRTGSDGDLLRWFRDGSAVGAVSVSGGVVTYGSFAAHHWSQPVGEPFPPDLPLGSVLAYADELCEWFIDTWTEEDGSVHSAPYWGSERGDFVEHRIIPAHRTARRESFEDFVWEEVIDHRDGHAVQTRVKRARSGERDVTIRVPVLHENGDPVMVADTPHVSQSMADAAKPDDRPTAVPKMVDQVLYEEVPERTVEIAHVVTQEKNDNLAKCLVCDLAADRNVAGVFGGYDDDGDVKVVSIGAVPVRVIGPAKGGDLIEAAGHGVARAQSGAAVTAATLGRVTIGDDRADERLVACVLLRG